MNRNRLDRLEALLPQRRREVPTDPVELAEALISRRIRVVDLEGNPAAMSALAVLAAHVVRRSGGSS